MTDEVVLELDDQRKAFYEERQQGLGSTDSPVVLGLSRRKTPFQLYAEKRDEGTPRPQTLPMWLGLRMESIVAELYATSTGRKVRADNRIHRHPEHDFLYCHLDYRVVGGEKRLVECKTSSRWDIWGATGTADIPIDYWVQIQHQLAITGLAVCDLALLLSNREFRVYPIVRDDDFIPKMIEADREFWFDNVLAGVPPLDGSEAAERFLRDQYPDATEGMRPATAAESLVVERLRLAVEDEKEAKHRYAVARQELEDTIKESQGIYGPGFRVSWKPNKPTVSTAWSNVAAGLMEIVKPLRRVRWGKGTVPGAQAVEFLVDLNTSETPGPRVFRPTWTKKEQ